jgi:beta-lactam-binding protein with PASTA domain/tRNA A-37 threonylcarbamoyl transferase component Bud32
VATSRIAEHVGRVLGDRYRLTRPLGTGASAHVYVAEDVTLRRRVAVKLLHPALADDEAFLRRFQAEARVVAALRHPHIVRVYDWGENDGSPFLVMELLEGGSLRSILDRGYLLTPAEAALVGADAASALDYAHRRGLVHRDIKPANLLFDEEGRVSIADFGLARALAEATWTEPAGAVLGTARYAAPEQVRGMAVDGKADVYALALVLIEAVTGSVPFVTDTTIGTLMARVDRPLPLPEGLGPLAFALAGAGSADVAGRTSAGELSHDLQEAARELPAPKPLPLAGPLLTGQVEDDAEVTEVPGRPVVFDGEQAEQMPSRIPPAPPRRRRRRRSGWMLILVAVAAILGAAGLFASRLLTPSHPVPSVVQRTEAEALRTLSPLKFHLRVSTAYHDQVPKGSIIGQHPVAGHSLREGSAVSVVVSLGPSPVPVPDLTGLTVDQASQRLAGAQLSLGDSTPRPDDNVRAGLIVSWSGEGGQLPKGSRVDVVVSSGPPTVAVPDIVHSAKSFADAAAVLQSHGLSAVEDGEFSDSVAKGHIIATNPPAGAQAPNGSAVAVTVSKGPDLVAVPNVRSMSVDAATRALEAQGFAVSGVAGAPDRPVSFTSPAAGTLAKRGSAVKLYTS